MPSMPSVCYLPTEGEFEESDIRLPWQYNEKYNHIVFGELALKLGVATPTKLVTSAKSWLSNANKDPRLPILPWGESLPDTQKISPVDFCEGILSHIVSAWNNEFFEESLQDQEIIITVPASFDSFARQLIYLAARRAGLKSIHLLEEPQAACYGWLWANSNNIQESLQGTRLILVIDIGGGTSDFSLISASADINNEYRFKRIAVGDHILLGGDNIDLALTQIAENELFSGEKRLSPTEFTNLRQQCKLAKETILKDSSIKSFTVSSLGKGNNVIGGSKSTELTRETIISTIFEGFFPKVNSDTLPTRRQSALTEIGLQYAQDPAFVKHLAEFLSINKDSIFSITGGHAIPDTILLNGGIFSSDTIVKRTHDIVSYWRKGPVNVLRQNNPESGVSVGASAYGIWKFTRGAPLILSDSARSYFLAVDSVEVADPRLICILPKGTKSEHELILSEHRFSLKLGQTVIFRIYSTTANTHYQAGELTRLKSNNFHAFPPLETILSTPSPGTLTDVPVLLATVMTEFGDLNLRCISQDDSDKSWNLTFKANQTPLKNVTGKPNQPETSLPNNIQTALTTIFGKKDKSVSANILKTLRIDLENSLGKRDTWNINTTREIADTLIDRASFRRRSADHERTWLNLTGFCMRPGKGVFGDEGRISNLWDLFSQGIQFSNESQTWSEWWILWRRVSAGLNAQQQYLLYENVIGFLNNSPTQKANNKKRGQDDIIRLLGALELLPTAVKVQIGQKLFQLLPKSEFPEAILWAIGRIGARKLIFADSQHTVSSEVASAWLSRLLNLVSKTNKSAMFAITAISRKTDIPELDIPDGTRLSLVELMEKHKAPSTWISLIKEVRNFDDDEQARFIGEHLPPGLILL